MFETITLAPPDAILGVTEAFNEDANPHKINLGVGVYQNDAGVTPVLETVKKAAQKILQGETTKSYLPMTGLADYGDLVQKLLFGDNHAILKSGRLSTAHTPGGTGGLRVGGDFLNKFVPGANVWMSDPTWANHQGIFAAAGLKPKSYPYFDEKNNTLNFSAMCDALYKVPEKEIVLLHVCCHNPTGIDPTPEQWQKIAEIAKERKWIPFLDFAYQGLAVGLVEDRAGLLAIAEKCPEFLVASSFSKNFGLYRERTGALTLVAGDAKSAEAALSHLKLTIRVNYSNPPAHGVLIVVNILKDPALRAEWETEVTAIRTRINSVRTQFVNELKKRGVKRDFSFIERQKGMFSFSSLTQEQVDFLREKKGIYIVKGGRINVAGITSRNINYLCDCLADVLK